ncbi:MAG: hypothetical protein DYG89_25360 [Caldilinea sp. CFX5]|nr:hypothetical protein [Caldilinea sp. CFX5]
MNRFLSFILRLIGGLLLVAVLVVVLFAQTLRAIPTWGATPAEVTRVLPGDELTVNPTLLWTNAITINAPPAKVWPWIAQLGDTRGGFYSYTFIENQIGALTGAKDYNVVYVNASAIHPEWQQPQVGEPIIQDSLKIREVAPGQYLLADSITPVPFLWVWGWFLEPVNDGTQTRLLVRFAIEVPATEPANPVMGFMMNVGGFVMQQNMLQGIKLRAEGQSEPGWLELVEIVLWVTAMLCGLVAAMLYLFQRAWLRSLVVATVAVVVLFLLTFVQPPLWVRLVLDLALVAGVVQSIDRATKRAPGAYPVTNAAQASTKA